MSTPVVDNSTSTTQRVGTGTDIYSTDAVVVATYPVSEDQNYGVPVRRTQGDGRQWAPFLLATPGTLVAGQYWLEKVGPNHYLRFVDTTGAIQTIQPSAATVIVPVNLNVGANTLASIKVDDIGLATWYVGLTKGSVRALYRVDVVHNGTTGADASTGQIMVTGGVNTGTVDVTFSYTLTGAGTSQQLNLVATAATSGWSAYARDDVQVPA